MAERVGDAADAITIELICDGARQLGASCDRPADDGIDVVDVEMEANRRPADGLWTNSRRFRDVRPPASRTNCR
jgi:hypothetical protein